MTSYQWTTIGGCGTILGSSTSQSVNIQFPTVGTCTVQLTIIDPNGCTNTCTFPVTVNPPPVCTISGPPAVCVGTTGVFMGPAGMASYQWSVPGGCGGIVGSSTSQSVTVLFPDVGPCSVVLTIVDANGCSSSCMVPVTVNPPPACSISGPDTVCNGDMACFTAPPGMMYNWSASPCGTIIGSSSMQQVCVEFTGVGPCAVMLEIVDPVTMCSSTCVHIIEMTPIPAVILPPVIVLCPFDLPYQICAGVAGGTPPYEYLWSTGETPPCITVNLLVASGSTTLNLTFDCEDDQPGWNFYDNAITLTGDQPIYWSLLSGQPAGLAPFTALDSGSLPGRPANDGTGDRMLRGFVIGWAVRYSGEEIKWNHLAGTGVIMNHRDGYAWEYNTFNFPVVDDTIARGDPTGTPGVLNMNGNEYAQAPSMLAFDFQAVGSLALSGPRQVTTNTDLTLHPVSADLRDQGDGPLTTKAFITIWNQNEVKFSGTERCITCWDQSLLSDYNVPHFIIDTLQTDHGKARVDGVESQVCDVDVVPGDGPLGWHPGDIVSEDAALLGVIARLLTFDGGAGGYAAHGTNLVGMGYEPAVIEYDMMSLPQESPAPLPAVRGSADMKGSLVVWSNVELRWDAMGFPVQDTFLSLTNDYPEDVRVQLYFINGDPPVIGVDPLQGGGDEVGGGFDELFEAIKGGEEIDTILEKLDGLTGAIEGGAVAP
jgi:PKD repeat protein